MAAKTSKTLPGMGQLASGATRPIPQQRLISLDVFRGMTIAFMILVNNPGSWSTVYSPLLHADWHGATPTDWVFPFFLFIVGVAIPLSLGKRLEQGVSSLKLLQKAGIRALIIFGLGLLLAAYPRFGMDAAHPLIGMHYSLLAVFLLAIFLREILRQPQYQNPKNTQRRRRLGWIALTVAAGMFVLGWFHYDLSHLRIPGVLQRIAVVYLVCSLLFVRLSWRGLLTTGIVLLLVYWALLGLIPVPIDATLAAALQSGDLSSLAIYGELGEIRPISERFIAPNLGAGGNLGAWLDRAVMHEHLWRTARYWDPEGLLSTLPAVVTGLIGVLCGMWLRSSKGDYQKIAGILASGAILLALGLIWHEWFPINKKIWTSSFVLYTGGLALLFLGVIYWLIDVHSYRRWAKPFEIYGANPLFAYILSGLIVKTALTIQWETGDGTTNLWSWIYQVGFTPFWEPFNASLLFALANVLVCFFAVWWLYRYRIFVKV